MWKQLHPRYYGPSRQTPQNCPQLIILMRNLNPLYLFLDISLFSLYCQAPCIAIVQKRRYVNKVWMMIDWLMDASYWLGWYLPIFSLPKDETFQSWNSICINRKVYFPSVVTLARWTQWTQGSLLPTAAVTAVLWIFWCRDGWIHSKRNDLNTLRGQAVLNLYFSMWACCLDNV